MGVALCVLVVAGCGGASDSVSENSAGPPPASATEPPPTRSADSGTIETESSTDASSSSRPPATDAPVTDPPDTDPPDTDPPATDPPATDPPAADCVSVLARGCEGEQVRDLQQLLTRKGFGSLEADGIFGPRTAEALDGFETGCGSCTADGQIAPGGTEWTELESMEDASTASWPTVFGSWVGGGDPRNICSDESVQATWPVVPAIGTGFDLAEAGAMTVRLGLRHELCLANFDTTASLMLTVAGPDGTRTMTVAPSGASDVTIADILSPTGPDTVSFEIGDYVPYVVTRSSRLDGPAPGDYELTAEQGTTTVARTLRVEAGDVGDPNGRVITADDPSAWNPATVGQTLRAVLVGFPPGSVVPMALYRGTSESRQSPGGGDGAAFEFVGEVAPASIGPLGWAYYDFVVPELDPVPGLIWDYCLVPDQELRTMFCQPYVDAVFDFAG